MILVYLLSILIVMLHLAMAGRLRLSMQQSELLAVALVSTAVVALVWALVGAAS